MRLKARRHCASGANTVKSCSEASGRNADNLSNELTDLFLDCATECEWRGVSVNSGFPLADISIG
jgi:hypothetical protein